MIVNDIREAFQIINDTKSQDTIGEEIIVEYNKEELLKILNYDSNYFVKRINQNCNIWINGLLVDEVYW